jgi:uncharacterized protein
MATNRQLRNRELIDATLLGNVESVDRLLRLGADPNARDGEHGETPLMLTSNAEIVGLLLRHGADVNATDERGQTPFLSTGCRLLVDAGADIDAQDESGETSLMKAVQNCDADAIGWLIRIGADVNTRAADGKSAREIALDYGFVALAELLGKAGASGDGPKT